MIYRIKLFVVFTTALIGLAACLSSNRSHLRISESKSYEASLFRQHCAICHGAEAEGKTLDDGRQTPNLRRGDFKYTTDGEIRTHITEGGNGMVPFRDMLTDREINQMVDFVQNDLRTAGTK